MLLRLTTTFLVLPLALVAAVKPPTWQGVIVDRGTHSGNPKSPLDLRVTPGLGTKGYGKARISVITNSTDPLPDSEGFFEYKNKFQYRWTNKFLHSSLRNLSTGKPQTFSINGTTVTINYPAEHEGTRGIIIADPCFHGAYMGCSYGGRFQTFSRMTELLNSAAPSIDYWMILGDNFYDRYGNLSTFWYDQLTIDVKSKIFATVAGNHDYWSIGSPLAAESEDQFGNGHMQFYSMDSVASVSPKIGVGEEAVPGNFFDFSRDPDKATGKERMAGLENFFSYFKIGNAGFILYSGGYTYDDTKPYFSEGCKFLKESQPEVAFIVGHWNDYEGILGCTTKMTVPAVYEEIRSMDGCAQLDKTQSLKYIMGHTHCNKVTEKDTGFMVAGQGMEGCGNFGVPYVDTRNGRVEIVYFNVQDLTGVDKYETIVNCFKTKGGPENCKELGTVWLNHTL